LSSRFPRLEAALVMTLAQIAKATSWIDPASIDDPQIRQQVKAAQVLRDLLYSEPKPPSE
jgi:hypothetical protein